MGGSLFGMFDVLVSLDVARAEPKTGKIYFENSTTIHGNTHNLSEWRMVFGGPPSPKLPKNAPSPTVQRRRASKQHAHTLLQRNTHRTHRSTVPNVRTRLWQWRALQSRLSQIPLVHLRLSPG